MMHRFPRLQMKVVESTENEIRGNYFNKSSNKISLIRKCLTFDPWPKYVLTYQMYSKWNDHKKHPDVQVECICKDRLMRIVKPAPTQRRPYALPQYI